MSRRTTGSDQKRLLGNPGHRPVREGPEFAPGVLAAPERWPEGGQERLEWARIVPDLVKAGIGKGVHQGLLEGICELYAARVELSSKGDYRGARLQASEYRKALGEFGLTAASASRVGFLGGSGVGDSDPTDEFFNGPKLAR